AAHGPSFDLAGARFRVHFAKTASIARRASESRQGANTGNREIEAAWDAARDDFDESLPSRVGGIDTAFLERRRPDRDPRDQEVLGWFCGLCWTEYCSPPCDAGSAGWSSSCSRPRHA